MTFFGTLFIRGRLNNLFLVSDGRLEPDTLTTLVIVYSDGSPVVISLGVTESFSILFSDPLVIPILILWSFESIVLFSIELRWKNF